MKSACFRPFLVFGLAAAILLPLQTSAHHSFASEFDINQPVDVTGAVTVVEWTNPHGRIRIDVEENGELVNYNFELPSPNQLTRQGWSRNDLQPGDVVRITGSRARTRRTVGRARGISRENGEAVFGRGNAADGAGRGGRGGRGAGRGN